jgi:CRP-like cAMP-binding protein
MTQSDGPIPQLPIFSQLTPAELVLVSRAAREVHYAKGQRLFSAGREADACWIIHSGRIALDTFVPGKGPVVIQTIEPGELVGWSWLVPPYRWHFGATAVEATTASQLDTIQLRALAEQDPRFGYRMALTLFKALLQRLHATRARLLELDGKRPEHQPK